MPQEKINTLLIEKAGTNKIVVRLKGGDPYLFGRGGEEAEACADEGIDFEVVPEITSALAAAAIWIGNSQRIGYRNITTGSSPGWFSAIISPSYSQDTLVFLFTKPKISRRISALFGRHPAACINKVR